VSDETYPEYTGPTLSREELYNQGAVLEETYPEYTGPTVPVEELTAVIPQ